MHKNYRVHQLWVDVCLIAVSKMIFDDLSWALH